MMESTGQYDRGDDLGLAIINFSYFFTEKKEKPCESNLRVNPTTKRNKLKKKRIGKIT